MNGGGGGGGITGGLKYLSLAYDNDITLICALSPIGNDFN